MYCEKPGSRPKKKQISLVSRLSQSRSRYRKRIHVLQVSVSTSAAKNTCASSAFDTVIRAPMASALRPQGSVDGSPPQSPQSGGSRWFKTKPPTSQLLDLKRTHKIQIGIEVSFRRRCIKINAPPTASKFVTWFLEKPTKST